jgi:O-antigen/teichoic acid export membrane protein
MASQFATTDNLPIWASWFGRLRALFGTTARQGLWGLVDQVVVSGTNFLTTVILGRFCGAGELGAYMLGFTVLMMIAVTQKALITCPYTVFINRLVGNDRAHYAGSVLMHYVMLALLAIAGLGIAAIFMPSLWVLIVVAPFILLRDLARRTALAHLRVRQVLVLDVMVAVLQIGLLGTLALAGRLTVMSAFLIIAGSCATAGLGWLGLNRRAFIIDRKRVRSELTRSWKFGRWVFASQMTGALNDYCIYWLIAIAMGAQSTGMLAACMTIVLLANPVVLGVANIFEPRAARALAIDGPQELSRVTWKVTWMLAATMTAFVVMVGLLGEDLMVLLYGVQYAGHQRLITIMAVCKALQSTTMPCSDALRVLEGSHFNFQARLMRLAITLVGCAVLIPSHGLIGVAYACLGAAVVDCLWRVLAFCRQVYRT